MREHIGIRVAQQAALVGNVDPADDTSTPLHQTVDVVAVANAQVTEHGEGPLPRPCGQAESRLRDAGLGHRHLKVIARALDTADAGAMRSTSEESSVPIKPSVIAAVWARFMASTLKICGVCAAQ